MECLIGISLIPDIEATVLTRTNIGMLRVPQNILLQELRNNIKDNLTCIPDTFCFCTNEGWSIGEDLEKKVLLKDIITERREILIQRKHASPKIGVRIGKDQVIGFLFCSFHEHLNHVRTQVQNLSVDEKQNPLSFHFLDANGWPVSLPQEATLQVLDIISGSCITVSNIKSCLPINCVSSPNSESHRCLPIRGTRELSFRTSKDLDRSQLADSSVEETQVGKQILISYVRAEAADHAIILKQELSNLGFSVYLDVHEIRSGIDWQDSLNYAVSNCEIFVPLVTQRYGETQWTNREVKLADVLGKFIIPINFLEEWPPRCLAIQFSTVQFVSWRQSDEKFGDSVNIRSVAVKIKDRINRAKEEARMQMNKKPSLVKRRTVVKSCAMVDGINDQAVPSDREGQPLIVVCLHPVHTAQGGEMKKWLQQQRYEVWLTTEIDNHLSPTSSVVENLQVFQEKADDAGVVIVILTKEYLSSEACLQQLYYCEQRKRIVAVNLLRVPVPGWIEMLLTSEPVQLSTGEDRWNLLQRELTRNLNLSARKSPRSEINEAKINCAVRQLQKVIDCQRCVYITGSVSVSAAQEALCRVIGTQLCNLSDFTLITGGFFGTEYIVGKAFHESAIRNLRSNKVWHILPEQDSKDRSLMAAQHPDGRFQLVDYGQTYFCGDTIEERDNVVSRAFDTCIVLIGDSRCINVVQKFAWNDHCVIPVKIRDELKISMPSRIFDVPKHVEHSDWKCLNLCSTKSDAIGHSLKNIIASIQSNLRKEDLAEGSSSPSHSDEGFTPPKKKIKRIMNTSPVSQKTPLSSMKTVIL